MVLLDPPGFAVALSPKPKCCTDQYFLAKVVDVSGCRTNLTELDPETDPKFS